MHTNWTNKASNKAKNKGFDLLMKKDIQDTITFDQSTFFEAPFSSDHFKNSSIFFIFVNYTRAAG